MSGDDRAEEWKQSRSGASAGRGFHFQDAVGALVAASVASGTLPAAQIVPEGREDLSLERDVDCHYQIKSRRFDLGLFPPATAARHIGEALQRQRELGIDGSSIVMVFERGIKGVELPDEFKPQSLTSMPENSPLRTALKTWQQASDIDDTEFGALEQTVAIIAISWHRIDEITLDELHKRTDLPASGNRLVARRLQALVADTADANSTPELERRRSLGISEITHAIQETAALIDADRLESAIRTGVCEPLVYDDRISADDQFYEGIAAQPRHVASGLVVPREDVLNDIDRGLAARSAVVITGPSGVGKSAVLWTVPKVCPRMLWFRIRHLSAEVIPDLIALARAHEVHETAPVGFLFDTAGADLLRDWAQLRVEAAAVPGLMLVCAVRNEDLIMLGDLSDCAVVDVQLDRSAAQTIFEGLERRGVAQESHWVEAYEHCNGLTMEYVHQLTKGRRLAEVIEDQVRERIREKRDVEFDVLRLVATADRWSAPVPVSALARACRSSEAPIRRALSRLEAEHLAVEHDGLLRGVHQLRSRAICVAAHRYPPPDLNGTVKRVLGILPDEQVHRFVAGALRDEPDTSAAVIDAARSGLSSPARLAGLLHGARLADFADLAEAWGRVITEHAVAAADWVALFASVLDGVADGEDNELVTSDVRASLTSISLPSKRDALIDGLGPDAVAKAVVSCRRADDAADLLAVCDRAPPGLADAIAAELDSSVPLIAALESATLESLSAVLAAAAACGTTTYERMLELMGGEEHVVERIRLESPWVLEFDPGASNKDAADRIAYARSLYISQELHRTPEAATMAIEVLLCNCFPWLSAFDIGTEAPDGTLLHRRTTDPGRSSASITVHGAAWSRARLRVLLTLLGDSDTSRLSAATPVLDRAATILRDASAEFASSLGRGCDLSEHQDQIDAVRAAGRRLKPARPGAEFGESTIRGTSNVLASDALGSMAICIADICASLPDGPEAWRDCAVLIRQVIVPSLVDQCEREPWTLIDIEPHPHALDQIRADLTDLADLLDEAKRPDADLRAIRRAARAGGEHALQQAAKECRSERSRRLERIRQAIEAACRSTGLTSRVMALWNDDIQRPEYAVLVDLPTLFDWASADDLLQNAIANVLSTDELCLLIPHVDGRPVPAAAMWFDEQVLPAQDLGPWEAQLAEPHPNELSELVIEATLALHTVSALGRLPPAQQRNDLADDVLRRTMGQVRAARDKIARLAPDKVTTFVLAAVDEVVSLVAEEDGSADGPSPFAGLFWSPDATDEASRVLEQLGIVSLFALEWGANPVGAVRRLEAALAEDDEHTSSHS